MNRFDLVRSAFFAWLVVAFYACMIHVAYDQNENGRVYRALNVSTNARQSTLRDSCPYFDEPIDADTGFGPRLDVILSWSRMIYNTVIWAVYVVCAFLEFIGRPTRIYDSHPRPLACLHAYAWYPLHLAVVVCMAANLVRALRRLVSLWRLASRWHSDTELKRSD